MPTFHALRAARACSSCRRSLFAAMLSSTPAPLPHPLSACPSATAARPALPAASAAAAPHSPAGTVSSSSFTVPTPALAPTGYPIKWTEEGVLACCPELEAGGECRPLPAAAASGTCGTRKPCLSWAHRRTLRKRHPELGDGLRASPQGLVATVRIQRATNPAGLSGGSSREMGPAMDTSRKSRCPRTGNAWRSEGQPWALGGSMNRALNVMAVGTDIEAPWELAHPKRIQGRPSHHADPAWTAGHPR